MEASKFQEVFDGILTLNETEGPHTNVFEPKFQAREQAEKLMIALKNALKDSLPIGKEGEDEEEEKGGEEDSNNNNNEKEVEEEKEVKESATAAASGDTTTSSSSSKKKISKKMKKRTPITSEETKAALEKNSDDILRAQWQVTRVLVFLGNNAHELEDEKDAYNTLLTAARLACLTSRREFWFSTQKSFQQSKNNLLEPFELTELLKTPSYWMTNSASSFFGVQWLLDVLNSIGVFFSARMEAKERIGDAICILHKCEEIIVCFNAWAKEKDGDSTTLQNLPWKREMHQSTEVASPMTGVSYTDLDFEHPSISKLATEEERKKAVEQVKRRLHLEQRYTSTLYYLAQGYGLRGEQVNASKYCHLTMVHQLLCRKDFSKKDWATNAVHISNFYVVEGRFNYAKHCLDAADFLMPKEDANEETLGTVFWGYAKLYRVMLREGVKRQQEAEEEAKKSGGGYSAPKPLEKESCGADKWWVDMPLPIPPPVKPSEFDLPTTFEQARALFKKGHEAAVNAQKYYVYEGCCPEYIQLCNDISDMYYYLAAFEPDVARRIVMHERRVQLLEKFPYELNFDSYTQKVRQSLFDLGDIVSEIVDLRHEQRQRYVADATEAMKLGKKLKPPHGSSDAAVNALVTKGQKFFTDFIDTYIDKKGSGKLPKRIDVEALPAFVRAKIRIARLEGKFTNQTPQQEYEMVKRMKEKYQDVTDFAKEQNALERLRKDPDMSYEVPGLKVELDLAGDMQPVLDGKMREIWRSHANK